MHSTKLVWYDMVPLLPPAWAAIWTGRQLSMLRLSPFRPRLFGDGWVSFP
jgi:hypothetical protein